MSPMTKVFAAARRTASQWVDALIHRHRHRPLIAVDAHSERIPDEDHLHPRLFGEPRRPVIVGRHPDQDFLFVLHLLQIDP